MDHNQNLTKYSSNPGASYPRRGSAQVGNNNNIVAPPASLSRREATHWGMDARNLPPGIWKTRTASDGLPDNETDGKALHKAEFERRERVKQDFCVDCKKHRSETNTKIPAKFRTLAFEPCTKCVNPSLPCVTCGGSRRQPTAGNRTGPVPICSTCSGTGKKTDVRKCTECDSTRQVQKTEQVAPERRCMNKIHNIQSSHQPR